MSELREPIDRLDRTIRTLRQRRLEMLSAWRLGPRDMTREERAAMEPPEWPEIEHRYEIPKTK